MKIFGFEFKLAETKKGKAKRMLRELGLMETTKLLENDFNWRCYNIKGFLFTLIHDGAMDLDLLRYYRVRGEWCLNTKLINRYKFSPKQVNTYVWNIKKFNKKFHS